MTNNKMKYKLTIIFLIGLFLLFINIISVNAINASVCCEQTKSGFYCQNVPESECAQGSRSAPTSCVSTSFCKPGTCYENVEGTCSGNTPQIVCNKVLNGSWNENKPAQCDLGCCILGDQAAFVPLVRCKRLSGFLGLQTNYNKNIQDEVSCVLSVANQDKGACVFDSEFERSCKFTTRTECKSIGTGKGEFFKNKLCTAPELNTICGRTKDTLCVPGKDEVYFKDTCGNAANIYDSSKVEDVEYWTNLKRKDESCNPNNANAKSKDCGNCNYILGSFCKDGKAAGASPSYGNNICSNLNCEKTQNGKSYKHGESWCVYNDKGSQGKGDNSVGARFYKHICINGEEVLEQCADFKQEECIEDKIKTSFGDFSQAACRVNRWQQCLVQGTQLDCENADRRDCIWKSGITLNSSVIGGACIPKTSPGLKFWDEESKSICAQANTQCIVVFEKDLFGGEKCVQNCECLTGNWAEGRNALCKAIGDCGPKINWIGQQGNKESYKVTTG